MKVSMIPDNSVKMIHASQDDAGRRWEFELYDEDGLIDVSSVGEQMFYPVYQGGTEQILPENTSTPTTSPLIADIVYPDELREEQEFLYRECPSSEDGNARIKKLIGNTVKFNQIIKNGNFASTANWEERLSGTLSISNNIATVTAVSANNNNQIFQRITVDITHKYLLKFEGIRLDSPRFRIGFFNQAGDEKGVVLISNIIGVNYVLLQPQSGVTQFRFGGAGGVKIGDVLQIKNIQLFDLTLMFGTGSEPTAEQFEAWLNTFYPLPYYDYTQGTLIPFTGEQIKTMNADQTVESIVNLPTLTYFSDGMKSAGSVYDELTENKAVQRVGKVDLGTLNWVYDSNTPRFYTTDLQSVIAKPATSDIKGNIESIFELLTLNQFFAQTKNLSIAVTVGGNITIIDTAYTTAESFKTAMSGQYLYFELNEPVETPITTASLVSQNQEIPMTVEDDKLVAYSTSEITEQSGFHDAKIKLSNDGVAYSAKFTLHVERKP